MARHSGNNAGSNVNTTVDPDQIGTNVLNVPTDGIARRRRDPSVHRSMHGRFLKRPGSFSPLNCAKKA